MKNKKKKIVFLTGTRADFGKIKPLISSVSRQEMFEPHIFVTGMHMSVKYGYTVEEVRNCGFPNIYQYINGAESGPMDSILASTIAGFGHYVKMIGPDLIVVHGDRVEALAGATVGALNNILVAHVEGGEISGTIDEHMRHAISKISHSHFVANSKAKVRLIQMGENKCSVFVIGSPDLDVMVSQDLPGIKETKNVFEVPFQNFALLMYHPETTIKTEELFRNTHTIVDAVLESEMNYVAVYPNNDFGNDIILDAYSRKLSSNGRFKIFPSIRFEHFLSFLKHSDFVIGNSSAGIIEAPFYGVPSINVGDRQKNRWGRKTMPSLFNCRHDKEHILRTIKKVAAADTNRFKPINRFGTGGSAEKFVKIIKNKNFWETGIQKQFIDLDY